MRLPRPTRLAAALLAAASFLSQRPAHAAGLGIPDLGGAALGQGGAFIAHPTDGTAVYYNPAALADLPGLRLEMDARATWLQASFARDGRLLNSGQPDEGTVFQYDFQKIANSGGASIAPFPTISYRLKSLPIPLTIAIGGHPFNGYTGARYPDPQGPMQAGEEQGLTNADYDEIASKTGQRYSAIESSSAIFVPVLAFGAQVTPWLNLGFSFQATVANFRSKTAIYAAPSEDLDDSGTGESPKYDALFTITAWDVFTPSGVLGAVVKLPADLFLGLSYQLPTTFGAAGTVETYIPPGLTDLGVSKEGDKASINITFPWIARAGLRLVKPQFEVELAGTYEAWSMQKEIILAPKDIVVVAGTQRIPLPEIRIAKDLQDAGSVRLGAVIKPGAWVDSLKFLQIRLGGLYETSAVPMDKQTIDTPHWERFTANVGVGMTFDKFDVAISYAHFLQADRVVTNSTVEQTVAFKKDEAHPDWVTPNVVGNGTYSTQVDVVTAMVSYWWDI